MVLVATRIEHRKKLLTQDLYHWRLYGKRAPREAPIEERVLEPIFEADFIVTRWPES